MRGTIENIERLYSGEYRITFLTREKPDLEKLRDEDVNLSIKKYKEKRSIDANAYYWVLLSKFSEVMGFSKPYAHNYFLCKYGQLEVCDGKNILAYIPCTEKAFKQAAEDEYIHLKPTSNVKMGNDGVMYRMYKLVKGSSAYDTYEMAKLIDGLVAECQENGIETLTPDELNRLKEQWGIKIEQKNKSIAV